MDIEQENDKEIVEDQNQQEQNNDNNNNNNEQPAVVVEVNNQKNQINQNVIDCEGQLPAAPIKLDKQEPLKHEHAPGQNIRSEQLRLQVGKKLAENPDFYSKSKWQSINASSTTTKQLPFQGERNAYNFWKSQVTNDAKDIYYSLFHRQIVQSILKMINDQMKDHFSEQHEKDVKKRLFKLDQIYEYFGVKILMGYNRMPDPEDYFNDKLPFRNKIGELIKVGRFKFLEQNTNLRDEVMIQAKYHNLKQEDVEKKFKVEGEVYSYLTKKLNKKFRISHDAGQCLAVIKNNLFEAQDLQGRAIECILLMDVQTQYIIAIRFCFRENISNTIFNMLDPYKHKNHKLYFQQELLTLEQVQILVEFFAIYSCGILASTTQTQKIDFKDGLVTNNHVMLLKLLTPNQADFKVFASTADGFHRNTSQDKKSYAVVIYQEYIKLVEQYPALSDAYKCLFSSATVNGAIYTEMQEIVIWNSFIAFKSIQKVNSQINFLEFRLTLAKQLLRTKMKNIPNVSETHHNLQTAQPRYSTIGIVTDIMGSFNPQDMELLPKINFHVPRKCNPPAKLQNKLVCLVCKKVPTEMVECESCSEISGKLITLCASECFSLFHQEPKKYVQSAMDLPVLQQSAQFEQSTLGNSEAYQQSYMNRQSK
ncbi:unnamed protein product [Paramecium pentaurelia]|uniref:PiggyBac transposable element-derived protein domain-containing protein n=1 Tax=Paramecium pentaurelia TaxID=43138 RepID=A0A8S1TQ38_9CILI|nr:unnamed protein product [Paramecium pentaurelia]